jgi:hypothetical protein
MIRFRPFPRLAGVRTLLALVLEALAPAPRLQHVPVPARPAARAGRPCGGAG